METMSISIRSSYYIFRRRNKPWTNPELLTIPYSLTSTVFASFDVLCYASYKQAKFTLPST